MKYINFLSALLALTLFSCSSGKKALQKGDYYTAVAQSVERLKTDPDNKNASKVLQDGYPLAITWSQEELDLALSSNMGFKWERAIDLMQQVNHLSDLIRSTPAARKIIESPKNYTSELNMAYEKAAEQRYSVGVSELEKNTQESARSAFEHFQRTIQLIPDYKDAQEKMETAKDIATLQVVVEAITVNVRNYTLSSEFFYEQVFAYLYERFPETGFVNFVSPDEAEKFNISQPDYVVQMEFTDFSVGNIIRSQEKKKISKTEEVTLNDSTKVKETYRAELKIYTDKIISDGSLSCRIIDFQSDKLIQNRMFHGAYTWINEYAIYAGDSRALTAWHKELISNDAQPLPPKQDLFVEFTRPIYTDLTTSLYSYFRKYK